MKNWKVLNLYAGIGGNRKLWENVEVTAIESNKKIARVYQQFFPKDKVIITDAHKFLEGNFENFDFIWSSPPCPSHSRIRNIAGVGRGQNRPIFPDMKLYEEIIFMHQAKRFGFEGKWVIENVRSYYKPLIKPQEVNRHFFWANFIIPDIRLNENRVHNNIVGMDIVYGFDITHTDITDKRKVLRNMVSPNLGKHILECARNQKIIRLDRILTSLPPMPKGKGIREEIL